MKSDSAMTLADRSSSGFLPNLSMAIAEANVIITPMLPTIMVHKSADNEEPESC